MKRFFIIVVLLCFNQSGFSQVGINTSTPLSMLDINGNLNIKEVGVVNANVLASAVFNGGSSGSATRIDDGVYISLTPTSGSPEFILPNATSVPGRIYVLRNISSSADAKIYTFGGQFFSKDSISITAAPLTMPFNGTNKSVIVISDGTNWTYFN